MQPPTAPMPPMGAIGGRTVAAPMQPPMPPMGAIGGVPASFAPGLADQTAPPEAPFQPPPIIPPPQPQPQPAPQGLQPVLSAKAKGATSFPTTCPNPSCRRQVLVPLGGTAQCAFCGTLVDSNGAAIAAIAEGGFGLTGAVSEAAAQAAVMAAEAPRPKGQTVELQPGPAPKAVSLVGVMGSFRVLPGIESRVGRDGSLCNIALADGRVSGVHATLKLEGAGLMIRDDRSNNGTFVNGNRIPAGTWTLVPGGSQLRFGPIEFTVRHES